METQPSARDYTYVPPAGCADGSSCLAVAGGVHEGRRFAFDDRLEIGRYAPERPRQPGLLLIADPTVSWHHCVVHRRDDGACWVRDTSSNGTRLDGRRLVPNVETPLAAGQTLSLGSYARLRLESWAAAVPVTPEVRGGTVGVTGKAIATVLVGDIRDYTVLVRQAPPERLQVSVRRVFERLTDEVGRQGGTVKEYQGDAIFAFWEGQIGGDHAVAACRTALSLRERAERLARDRQVWDVPGYELQMDWALATGLVTIDTFGAASPTGLSMVGEPVVLAFRLEKLADAETGPILVCSTTEAGARGRFEFRDLGEMQAKGFEVPDRVFALEREVPKIDATPTIPGGI